MTMLQQWVAQLFSRSMCYTPTSHMSSTTCTSRYSGIRTDTPAFQRRKSCFPHRQLIASTQNHSMVGVGRDLCGSS